MSINFLCVTLWHMSIRTRIVISITFQKVDDTPYAKTGTNGTDHSRQSAHCTCEKSHISYSHRFCNLFRLPSQTDPEANPDFSGPITDVLLSSFLLLYAPVTQTHASASEAVIQASDYSACDKSTSITSTSSSGFGRYIGWISLSERYQFFGSASARYR